MKIWTALAAIAVVCINNYAFAVWPSIFDDRTGMQTADGMVVSSSSQIYTPGYHATCASCCDNVWAGYCSEPGHGRCDVVETHHRGGCSCNAGHGGLLGGLLGALAGHHGCNRGCNSGCATCTAGSAVSSDMIIIEDSASPVPAPPRPTPAPISFDRSAGPPPKFAKPFQILPVSYSR